ncbi:thiamine-phosphate kinase [Lysinibacter sp. HNR]|uniref:thiamine-phosphate kinase n=1 Tax=Lysinibacter sp. HNR TaxID=3031408 RepID=UPI0024350D3D|nr:thiamine-phosphate kinase [Lysinibacter sp. HNR]WGD38395.1 thiamine-phosphate kinase [Lysinibacter sp. HNR]
MSRVTENAERLISDLSEGELLARILPHFGRAETQVVGPGDDAAVLSPRGEIVATSDLMVEGPDFRRVWHSGFELGWKAAATNLSDVAAMGARPSALTVSLAMPANLAVSYVTEIARGLDAACATLAPGCAVVGGDLSRSTVLTLAVTALGDLEGRAPVLRSGARVGDVVAVAGTLGEAAAGLRLLFERCVDALGNATADGLADLWMASPELLAAQLSPSPPVPLGVVASVAGASAMMDISDSLSLDASRIAAASGVALNLYAGKLGAYPEDALTGGEDHALLATFAKREVPPGFRVIGEVLPPLRGVAVYLDGVPFAPRGWDPIMHP